MARAVLLQPRMDAILPSQMISHLRATAPDEERRVMAAVLEDAVQTYQRFVPGPGTRYPHLARKVEAWFASDDASHPLAFRHICAVLGVDAASLRDALGRWRACQESLTELTTHPYDA
jgi:hypothetical protein